MQNVLDKVKYWLKLAYAVVFDWQEVCGEGVIWHNGPDARETQPLLLPDCERPSEQHPPGTARHREWASPCYCSDGRSRVPL